MIFYTCASYALGWTSVPYLAHCLLARRSFVLQASHTLNALAALYCAVGACCAWICLSPLACLCLSFGCICMAALLICDLQARILPTELVALLLVFAAGFRLSVGSLTELIVLACSVCLIAILFALLNAVCRRWDRREILGMGDIRMLAPLALFSGISGVFDGSMACALVMGGIALVRLATGHADRSTQLAVAPGLAAWLLVGTLVPVFL